MRWDQEGLSGLGFTGFVPFTALSTAGAPRDGGVYVVVRPGAARPRFLERSVAGHYQGKDPTVTTEVLEQAWVPGGSVVYIGTAPAGANRRRGLHKRLEEFRRYGAGENVGHTGGAYVWQLTDHDELLVGWRPTSGHNPDCVEAQLLDLFADDHGGRLPFANRKHGRRDYCSVPWLPRPDPATGHERRS